MSFKILTIYIGAVSAFLSLEQVGTELSWDRRSRALLSHRNRAEPLTVLLAWCPHSSPGSSTEGRGGESRAVPCLGPCLSTSRAHPPVQFCTHPKALSCSGWKHLQLRTKDLWTGERAFPGGTDGKESACNVGDLGSIPGLGTSLGGEHGYPLQYSCLENPHGQRSLAGYSPWGGEESDITA